MAGSNAALPVLAAIGLFIPAVFAATTGDLAEGNLVQAVSFFVFIGPHV